ncbi:hypothetical protein SELMODRAFT_404421 [Selaginella moellendorffii]|uniref:Peptidase S9 prolyl oligopeptidase catalytic domain-containing protein n=1 Tax=Selaginella moellendorffii TaxID=88036 RepID=D8QVA0_SELML|nr:hypothetical protein SELMODRAFT_404421 [Selaginella moellendorffii]
MELAPCPSSCPPPSLHSRREDLSAQCWKRKHVLRLPPSEAMLFDCHCYLDCHLENLLTKGGQWKEGWIEWSHPIMPWDATSLYVGQTRRQGIYCWRRRCESLNGHPKCERKNKSEPLYSLDAEFTRPAWNFGNSSYEFYESSRGTHTGNEDIQVIGDTLFMSAGSPRHPMSIVKLVVRSTDLDKYRDYIHGSSSFLLKYSGGQLLSTIQSRLPEEKPPLLVRAHGEPTVESDTTLQLNIQFWRLGFFRLRMLLLCIGRLREEMQGKANGIVDVADCVRCASSLVVPAKQSPMIYEALKSKGVTVAMVEYEGEQHGFRKAETIKHSLEHEMFFACTVGGYFPADKIVPAYVNIPVPRPVPPFKKSAKFFFLRRSSRQVNKQQWLNQFLMMEAVWRLFFLGLKTCITVCMKGRKDMLEGVVISTDIPKKMGVLDLYKHHNLLYRQNALAQFHMLVRNFSSMIRYYRDDCYLACGTPG